jgi:mRNA-degrading endonuclease toxin of MazEF toxin-antitoxin module
VRRGEVWWHEPPDSKRRPVLILTRDEAVDLDNTLSAEKAFLTERITTLGPEKMAAVCSALATATSCR